MTAACPLLMTSSLNAAGGAGILAFHPDRTGSLLNKTSFIEDQYRLLIAQVFDDIVLEIVAYRVGVPAGAGQILRVPHLGAQEA
jgi:hypothetical protein